MSKEYLNFINKPPGSNRPSAIKIFPTTEVKSNNQTYQTQNQAANLAVEKEPRGIDEYNNSIRDNKR